MCGTGRPLTVELAGLTVLAVIGLVTVGLLANGMDAPWLTVLPQHLLAFALGMFLAVLSTHPLPDSARTRASTG